MFMAADPDTVRPALRSVRVGRERLRAPEQRREHHARFEPCQRCSDAVVNAAPEAEVQVAVAAVGLGSLRQRRLVRPAVGLAVAIDAMDMVSAVVEARARGRLDADVVGGFVLSAAGVATALAAGRAEG